MRPTSMPHIPAALTSISHSIVSPAAVWTVVQRRPSTVIAVTSVCSQTSCAAHACAAGDRLRHRRRIDVAVGRQERRGLDVGRAHQREQRLRLVGADDVHRQAERLGHRRQPAQLHRALGRARQAQAAGLVPVDCLPGLGLEPAVHLDRLLEHACRVARRAQLPDQSGGVPGRAVGELVLFEDHDVASRRTWSASRRSSTRGSRRR